MQRFRDAAALLIFVLLVASIKVTPIETVDAVNRIDEILDVEGVDATCIGPADLAMSMGIPVRPDNPHPDHVALCAEVLAASQRIDNRVAPGIFTSGPTEAKRRAEEGWLYIPSGSDSQFMSQASAQGLRTVRSYGQE